MPPAAASDDLFLREEAQGARLWHGVLYVFLVFVFVTGGSSQERGWTDAIAELVALPVLAYAIWRLTNVMPSKVRHLGLIAIAAVTLLPWLQLLPLSQLLWELPEARSALQIDLSAAGVAGHGSTWSLTPAATLRGALALLPALALFVAVLGVDKRVQRRLLIVCVALPLASLLLGFLQLGAPQDSLLNPYPQWAPAMNGTFANQNHQGTAMLVGLSICLAFAVGAFRSYDEDTGRRRNPWPAIIAGGTLLLGLPLTNSRAAVVIGVLLLVAAPIGMAASAMRRSGESKRAIIALVLGAAIGALGLSAAIGWMKVDEIDEIRWLMRHATFALAAIHLPWGSGIGSFVPIFQQALPEALLRSTYINAAHNDFSQVWLEGGVAGLVVVGIVTVAIFAAIIAHVRGHRGDRRLVWAAVLGMSAFVAHAGADYALRTPALATVAAILGGVLIAQGARSR